MKRLNKLLFFVSVVGIKVKHFHSEVGVFTDLKVSKRNTYTPRSVSSPTCSKMNYLTIKNASKGFVSVVGIKVKHLPSEVGVFTDL